MKEVDIDITEEFVTNELAKLLDEYAKEKDENKSKELKEKIDILKKIKIEILKGNEEIIKMIYRKKKKGILWVLMKKQEVYLKTY